MPASPFILIPAAPNANVAPSSHRRQRSQPTANRGAIGFKPPAHANAQHIHSVQPSPVNTRTLILEQNLSLLVDTRLAAAKAHLGIGGISQQLGPDSIRHQHEFYKSYTSNEQAPIVKSDDRLAAKLDSKATGMSSVLCAMLTQDPPHGVSSRSHHQLPNDVRFRLVVAILLEHYFAPQSPQPSSSKEKKPEIPLDLAPFVSLSSYRASSPSAFSRPSHPTLPPLKSLGLASSSSGGGGPQSPFAAFGSIGVSPRPPKPLFMSAGPSGISIAPPAPRPTMSSSPTLANSVMEKDVTPQTPVPVYRWPSQERSASKDNVAPIPNSEVKRSQVPKGMTTSYNWPPSSQANLEKEKSTIAAWDQGVTLQEGSSYCTRHLRHKCRAHSCNSSLLTRSERSSIGAGLDQRRSRLDVFSDTPQYADGPPRMLTVLPEFIRLSALLAPSYARRKWFALLAAIITRTVLEGYLLHEWRGSRAARVLFGFGGKDSRVSPRRHNQEANDSESESEREDAETEFLPDGYLHLEAAYKKLFAPSPTTSVQSELKEYISEMNRRQSEFLSPVEMPSGGLVAHLTNLNEKYSAEDLDEKLIDFFESIMLWNGVCMLERSRSDVSRDSKRLNAYFDMPATIAVNVAGGNDNEFSANEGADHLSEDEDSQDERSQIPRPLTPAVSKRPRAPSLSDSPPPSYPQSPISRPPLKKERLAAVVHDFR